MIRVDAAWFAVEPLDMRAGVDTALARVVNVFGEARAHHAYLFVNKRANRMKVLVHDGFVLWLCARRLYEGSFIRSVLTRDRSVALTHEQLQALVKCVAGTLQMWVFSSFTVNRSRCMIRRISDRASLASRLQQITNHRRK